jgi:predicted DNA binding CopG/RHH family protein
MKVNQDEVHYMDEPLEFGESIRDFLPSPDELAQAERRVKITISLSAESVEYFQGVADRHRVSYQKLIRRLLDEYVRLQKMRAGHRFNLAAD